MKTLLGTGAYRYEVVEPWARLPDDYWLGDVPAIGVDRYDHVYLFNRGPHPMVVLDQEGNFLRSWGEGIFKRPHGVHVAPDDTIYCTDEGDHTVRKCTLDGKVLLTIGVPGQIAPYMSGEPFNRCTHTALTPSGDILISDGYGNARIHLYTQQGKHLHSFGEPGTDPGQFNVPHNICCDGEGWIYVADRENHRVQIFDRDFTYETQWNNLHRPNALCMGAGAAPNFYIGEGGPALGVNLRTPNLGARVSIVTGKGSPLARLGARMPGHERLDQFLSPHGIAVDSHGDLYVGEVSFTTWPRFHKDVPAPKTLRSFRKLRKIA